MSAKEKDARDARERKRTAASDARDKMRNSAAESGSPHAPAPSLPARPRLVSSADHPAPTASTKYTTERTKLTVPFCSTSCASDIIEYKK
jgi:hypothetical protein